MDHWTCYLFDAFTVLFLMHNKNRLQYIHIVIGMFFPFFFLSILFYSSPLSSSSSTFSCQNWLKINVKSSNRNVYIANKQIQLLLHGDAFVSVADFMRVWFEMCIDFVLYVIFLLIFFSSSFFHIWWWEPKNT